MHVQEARLGVLVWEEEIYAYEFFFSLIQTEHWQCWGDIIHDLVENRTLLEVENQTLLGVEDPTCLAGQHGRQVGHWGLRVRRQSFDQRVQQALCL